MKTNYLKISMLAAVIALSSCSKDDEATTPVETVTYDPAVELDIEKSTDVSIANNTTTNTMVDFGGVLDNFTLPASRTEAEGEVSGPTICDQAPKTTLNRQTLTYTFTYDFPANSTCTFQGRNIGGKLSIVIDVNKNITFDFVNFSVTQQIFGNTIINTFTGKSVIVAGSNKAKRTFKFNNLKNSVTIKRGTTTINVLALLRNGEMIVATEGTIRTVNGAIDDIYNNILYKVTLAQLKADTTCPQSGFLSGTITTSNLLNTIVSTFNSTCEVQKLTVKNNGKENVVE